MGKRAVTGIGTASEIHQISISTPKARTFQASAEITAGPGSNLKIKNKRGPKKKPICFNLIAVWLIFGLNI
jgi:hypothetical protein